MPLRCSKSAATVRTTGAIAPAANTLRSSAEAGAAVRLAKEVTMNNCRNGKDSKRTVFLLKSEEAQRGTKKYEEVRRSTNVAWIIRCVFTSPYPSVQKKNGLQRCKPFRLNFD